MSQAHSELLKSYSLAKEFCLAREEFCRLGKESYSAEKEFNQAAEEFCRLQLLCKSARLLCGLTGKQFGQAELLFCRVELLGKRVGIFPGVFADIFYKLQKMPNLEVF